MRISQQLGARSRQLILQTGFGAYLRGHNGMVKPVLACLLAWTAFGSLGAQEWTRFRGPNGSGECEADGVPVAWGDKDYLCRMVAGKVWDHVQPARQLRPSAQP